MIRFDPQPLPAELPERIPSPFLLPHPLARRAAEALQARLRARALPGVDLSTLERPGFGKMFGVLVVSDGDGQVGYLSAFSGMLDGKWEVDGFVPPTFDQAAKAAFWPAFEAQLDADDARIAELEAQPSQEVEAALAALRTARADRSRDNWQRVTDTYRLSTSKGEIRTVTALFAPMAPPGAAGDCAGPKLLAHAYRHQLRPIAFAEFWWGAPSTDGQRVQGALYPACDRRCRVVLPFMLDGLDVEPMPPAAKTASIEIVFEDAWIIVAIKPAGLPPKPGGRARDSLLSRLRFRVPTASIAFAPDSGQAGLAVAAKDRSTLVQLQRAWPDAVVGSADGAVTSVEFAHPSTGARHRFVATTSPREDV